MLAISTLIFALVVLTLIQPSTLLVLILVIAVIDSTQVFRLSRAVAVDITVMDFVEVARLRAESTGWILRHDILPNALPPLLAEFGVRFCYSILYLSSLSFLGLGVQPPAADWGSMVRENAEALSYGLIAPIIPAAAIALLTIGVNLLVDWYLNRLEPRSGAG